MTDPHSMPSQDPALESFAEDITEGGHEELLDNSERGCGHLKHNAAYVRSDVGLSHPDGSIPRFVELDQPVEYREYTGRGAIIPGWREFPGGEFGVAYVNEGYTTTPEDAIPEHHTRGAETLRFDGEHYGEITTARAHDLLMSVGASHWPTPGDYIEECREQGLNLKIPAGPSQEPPVVNPLHTRCWIVHPNGLPKEDAEDRAAIIGYAVLTRTIYTTGEEATEDDPDIPAYAQEWADSGKVSLATPGPEVEADDDGEYADYADIGDWDQEDDDE